MIFSNVLRFAGLTLRNSLLPFIFFLIVLLQPILVISQQLDPIKNLCSRWDHQSALLNGSLYIDGGVQVFVDTKSDGTLKLGTQSTGINKNLLALDMTQEWTWRETMPFQNKDATTPNGIMPPPLISGALWPYENFLYLYGGTTSRLNDSFTGYTAPTTTDVVMWRYDLGQDKWDTIGLPSESGKNFPRLARGASTVVPDQGLAFWLGGEIDNGTSPETEGGSGVTFANRFFYFNFTTESIRNLSTDALGQNGARVDAGMLYIPGIGGKGILALVGGGYNSNGQLFPMDQISIFDIASIGTGANGDGVWYKQTATGEIPEPRMGFCIVVVSAPDKSSHNIFLYGGWNGTNYFDDVYILTLPTFRWIKVFVGDDKRIGHSCHVVGNRQLLTAGGRRVKTLPGECDWEPHTIALYDMVTLDWTPTFIPDGLQWEVPRNITAQIGGNANGNANITAPAAWVDGLEKVFKTKALATPVPPPSNTNPSPPDPPETQHKGLSKSVIIGLSIGLTLLALFLIYASIRIYRIYAAKNNRMNTSTVPPAELHTTVPLSAFQELLGSLGKPKMGNKVAELPADMPPYWRMRDSNGNPFELPAKGECDRNSLAERPVVEKPEGNWI